MRESLRQDLAERDKLRAARTARELGATQRALADLLGVSQPAVIKMLTRQPVRAQLIAPGHTGASPYEVAERYAAGQIDRARMRAELAAWDYTPIARAAGLTDDISVLDLHTFEAVEKAARRGLIDDDDYTAIADAYEARVLAGELPGVSDAP